MKFYSKTVQEWRRKCRIMALTLNGLQRNLMKFYSKIAQEWRRKCRIIALTLNGMQRNWMKFYSKTVQEWRRKCRIIQGVLFIIKVIYLIPNYHHEKLRSYLFIAIPDLEIQQRMVGDKSLLNWPDELVPLSTNRWKWGKWRPWPSMACRAQGSFIISHIGLLGNACNYFIVNYKR